MIFLVAVLVWTAAAFWLGARLGKYLRDQDELVSRNLARDAQRPLGPKDIEPLLAAIGPDQGAGHVDRWGWADRADAWDHTIGSDAPRRTRTVMPRNERRSVKR